MMDYVSKLPMRQLTRNTVENANITFSKLPMRQLTRCYQIDYCCYISKLPMRQLTSRQSEVERGCVSKLPMRQLTMLERKKKPTVRALIHLFPTLTQIYSCLEIY